MRRTEDPTSLRMKRRVRGWTTAAILLLLAACATVSVGQRELVMDNELDERSGGPSPTGRWREAREGGGGADLTPRQRQEAERLRSIGYLSGSKPAPSRTGITVHDRGAAQPGLNLYNSGHRAGATLMTMDGEKLHEWECPFLRAFPDSLKAADTESAEYWRFVHLFENGDILAIFEGLGLIKLDKDSNLLWAHPGEEHHALHVAADGRIYTLTRKAHMIPRLNRASPVLEDYITVLDPDGNVLRSFSLLEAFENSRFENAFKVFGMRRTGDLFHTNAIELLDGSQADRIPAFRKGNVLVSLRQLNLIAVIDMEYEEAVWISSGMWLAQHDPRFLPNGNILLFDNKGYGGKSKVLEFDPVTYDVAWSYWGTERNPFFSKMCGAAQRLPNGNTLITESDYGRAFEVTPGGEIVWEFLNPERAGARNQLIATLFEVTRVDPGDLGDWVGR
ncbi:MAG: hypothetical protein GF400_07540 [Candidatus Eisenbacteria bacterium]|nr:hypothetical protein [Candidatus Eisenbacteria bacterium]